MWHFRGVRWWGVIFLLIAMTGCDSQSKGGEEQTSRERTSENQGEDEATPPREIEWRSGPALPDQMEPASRPRVVLLHAEWCQWCNVLAHEVLPAKPVVEVLSRRFEVAEVDVDTYQRWMDLPGVDGLPSLVFFDRQGRHVLTRSGFRPVGQMTTLLRAVADKIESGALEPYERIARQKLVADAMKPSEAAAELDRFESRIFLAVNSNDGGFHSPSRRPYPALLFELARWRELGGPTRIDAWLSMTIESALRGTSPRLRGEPRAGMDFSAEELRAASVRGPDAGDIWRRGIESLPNLDPYLGIQDQIDHGVFRYAAGPGWYHPHFERMASENLAWVMLLDQRERDEAARQIREFVESTFVDGRAVRTSQVSDPFFYRLRRDERDGMTPPEVPRHYALKVQARAARVNPEHCQRLLEVDAQRWPRQRWGSEDPGPQQAEATPDAVGELLIALAECDGPAYERHLSTLVETVLARWGGQGLEDTPRLHRLAAGVCAAAPSRCPEALKSVEGLPLDLAHAPPLVALSRLANSSPE